MAWFRHSAEAGPLVNMEGASINLEAPSLVKNQKGDYLLLVSIHVVLGVSDLEFTGLCHA